MKESSSRPWTLWVVVVVLLLLAAGALPAGYLLIVDPSGAGLGMSSEWLGGTIFPNYLIPAIVLFVVIGLGGLFTAAVLVWRPRWGWAERLNPVRQQRWVWSLTLAMGLFLMAWITVQVFSMWMFHFLQPVVFGSGALIALLMAEPHMRRYFAQR